MADLRIEFAGIRSPNPFWLASAPPANAAIRQEKRSMDCGFVKVSGEKKMAAQAIHRRQEKNNG